MASIYDSNVLLGVTESLKRPQSALLDLFFPNLSISDTKFITFDVIVGKRRVAPFVSPLLQGKLVESLQRKAETFEPAYIKDKRVFDPTEPLTRAIGEQIGGSTLSPGERAMARLQFDMEDQLDMITRRLELMAADALLDGKLTVSGLGYDAVEIDFTRAAGLTVTLSGASRWGQSGIVPSDNIETWATLVVKESGVAPTDIVFTPGAWSQFIADQKVKDSIDYRRGGDSTIELGVQVTEGMQFKGLWGSYRLWLYNGWYINDAGSEVEILTDGTVIMGGPGIEGTRHFGSIQDEESGYQAVPFWPKSWAEKDPAVRYLMMQSAPLVVPRRPNASFKAQVI